MRSLAVLVSSGVLGIVGPQSPAPAASAGSGTTIFSAAVAVSDVHQLTTSPGSDVFPVPSPDGSLIAFVRDLNGSDSLYVMRSDGDGLAQLWSPTLPPDVPSETLGTPVWSPDGKTLLVTECVCVSIRATPRSRST
jgi:Tol biopolymer transport system component